MLNLDLWNASNSNSLYYTHFSNLRTKRKYVQIRPETHWRSQICTLNYKKTQLQSATEVKSSQQARSQRGGDMGECPPPGHGLKEIF